jgi:hypothetical protein
MKIWSRGVMGLFWAADRAKVGLKRPQDEILSDIVEF